MLTKAVIAPINYIEIQEKDGQKVARIAGTRLRVGEVAQMHLHAACSIEWIVENFEVLDYAKVYAALSYYYDHQSEIDAEMETASQFIESIPHLDSADHLSQIKARLHTHEGKP